jgi:hypothetical protein
MQKSYDFFLEFFDRTFKNNIYGENIVKAFFILSELFWIKIGGKFKKTTRPFQPPKFSHIDKFPSFQI